MIWDILLGLYLLGAAITFVYFMYKGTRACIRTAFGFKPQYKIWAPFNIIASKDIIKDLSNPIKEGEPEYFSAILTSFANGGMFGLIYPIYLPIYCVRQPIKIFIKTLAYKIVISKEEKVQRALGTDRPETPRNSSMMYNCSGRYGSTLQQNMVGNKGPDKRGPR
jgi:hypothetical protein